MSAATKPLEKKLSQVPPPATAAAESMPLDKKEASDFTPNDPNEIQKATSDAEDEEIDF